MIQRIHNTQAHDVVHSSAYARIQRDSSSTTQHSSMLFSERAKIEQNRSFVKGYGDSQISRGGNKMPHALSSEERMRQQQSYGRTEGDKDSLRKGYGRVSGDRNSLQKHYGRTDGDRESLKHGYGRTAGERDSLQKRYGRTSGDRETLQHGYGRTSSAGSMGTQGGSPSRFYSNNWYGKG